MILQLSEDEFVLYEDWSAIMEQMIPINYVGHGGTYDQQRRNRWRKDYRI
jgi:hypothetical protein